VCLYLRSDVRNLGRSLAELEELIESYRAFAVALTPPTSDERAALRKLLKRTLKIVGPPPGVPDQGESRCRGIYPRGSFAPGFDERTSARGQMSLKLCRLHLQGFSQFETRTHQK
jgi:hypothetical protein